MPKLTGVFEKLKGLDKILPEEIIKSPKNEGETKALGNFIGNRILYPQTVSQSNEDQLIDFAILKAFVKKNPGFFYHTNESKIIINEELVFRFPPILKLVTMIINVINPPGIQTIVMIKKDKEYIVGSYVDCKNIDKKGFLEASLDSQILKLRTGTLSRIKTPEGKLKLKIGDFKAEVNGGEVGVLVDLRTKKII